ncbi:MAG: tetratricopeptide repeat protein, partial [Methanospirillum sp.]|uniref:tetratricopeptide repeat protein n=1 Tax=Methanospirillum sp. TaxID=45200 RepID=UPI00236EEA6F
EQALEPYNQSLTYNPKNADTWINYGKSLWVLGMYQKSLDAYNTALSLRPNDPAALEGKNTVSGLISRYQKAVAQSP